MENPLNRLRASFIACIVSCLGVTPMASAQVFSNPASLNVPNGTTTATTYPSVITVPNNAVAGNVVRRVAVTIKGFTSTYIADTQILLVPPVGGPIRLMTFNNGGASAPNVTVTFFAEAPVALENFSATLFSGAYVPNPSTSYTFPTPAPAAPSTGSLSALTGINPTGNWSLYVADSFPSLDPVIITGGWELEFFADAAPAPTAFTYQGKLNPAVTGPINARFSVWQSDSSSNLAMRLVGPLTINAIPVNQGVFSTSVDFARTLPADRALWLEVEVESPAGSGFVKLTPRQPLTSPPVVSGGWSTQLQAAGGFPTINTASRVGIGVLKPSMSLQVATTSELGNVPTLGLTNGNNFLYASLPAGNSPGSLIWSNATALRFGVESSLGSSYSELMRIDESGNVGIATNAPSARLDVRGNIRLGNNSQYSAVGGTENLHIKRGSISALGTITGGSGFTVTRTGIGLYRIQWTAANGFSDFPAFTANGIGAGIVLTSTSGVINPDGSGNVDVRCTLLNGSLIDAAFSFTLIGAR